MRSVNNKNIVSALNFEFESNKYNSDILRLKRSLIALAIFGGSLNANAALVSPCTGVSLEPSIITDLLDDALSPTVGVLDTVALNPILGLLFPDLTSGLDTTLTSFLNGGPIGLDVLATNGTVVTPADECEVQSDSFTLETPKGISIGGNQITGLGNGTEADAGEINSIAFGNNASTDVAATNSIAIGTNATIGASGADSIALGTNTNVNVANSVAIGTGSTAIVGAETGYSAFALTTPQNSVGEVSVGSATGARKITNVAAGSSATDAVNVSQLQSVSDNAVQYDPLSLKMTVTLGGPISSDGGTTDGTKITNLSKGDISINSTDAVNGSQLFSVTSNMDGLGLSMATNLGGGATYDPVTGTVSAPAYSVYGTSQSNVGDAITALQTGLPVRYSDGSANVTNIVSNDVTLVGATTDPVRVHNVAEGVASTDAVNVSQLEAVSDDVDALDALAVKYDNASLDTIALAGPTSLDGGTTGGTKITNLSKGDISVNSTDAVNGSQLFNITSGFTVNLDALGQSMATNLGGGAAYDPATFTVSAPTYNVYGTSQTNIGDAITALQTQSPIQYLDSSGNPTSTVSDDVILVGSSGGPVGLHNVADGVAPTDAVNMSQLDAVSNNVALAVKYDDPALETITLAGPTSTDGGATGGTLLTNLQQGEISEFSTDAINGAQAFDMQQMIMNISNGGGIKYFQVNSTHNDSSATGVDSIAIGPQAAASGVGSVAMGMNSQATADGAIAIGQNSTSSGVNAIAIGNGALATGSVAVGNNAQAGNGGSAFGDDAIALAPQQGTAIGNAAVVTSNRGVALGAGSTATRGGMNGTKERFSNVSVTSTEGAVSVGSAGNERQITNVAGGTAATDAVNVRQLDAAMEQTTIDVSNQMNGLRSDISTLKHDAYAGIASAMALASMPQSAIPGKVLVAAGAANYEGQSAMSVGVSNFSENGRWVVNFNGSANTRGKAGAAVGVGFHW